MPFDFLFVVSILKLTRECDYFCLNFEVDCKGEVIMTDILAMA